MTQQQRDIKRKLAVLRYAEECGNVALAARRYGVSRQCFYNCKRAYAKHGGRTPYEVLREKLLS